MYTAIGPTVRDFPMAQTLLTGLGERRIAAATIVANSTKDSVTNVKNETNSAKGTCIGYLDEHISDTS